MKNLTEEQQKRHEDWGWEYYYEPYTDSMEFSQVRTNMMKDQNYTPYCMRCTGLIRFNKIGLDNQMKCPVCGVKTEFPIEFINKFKEKHNLSST